MLPGGPKLKENQSGSNCSASMCPSALRLWWEVAQWRTSSSTLSSDASLWHLPEPSHTRMWIQGVWRCMPRVLRQFCRSIRDSSGWDPARHLRQQNIIREVLEMGVQGSGGGQWALSAVQQSLPSELSEDALGEPEAFCPLVSHLSLLLMLNFQFSSFFFFFLVPWTFPKFASFPCSLHLIFPPPYISLNNAPFLSSILHSCFNNSTMGMGIFTLPLFSFSLYLNDFPSAAYIHSL